MTSRTPGVRYAPSAARRPRPASVLRNRGFFILFLVQLLGQTAQNALLFGLLVVVTDLTKTSTFTSVLVLSYVVPTFIAGVFSGVLVDLWSKRRLLILTNLIRALATVGFLLSVDHAWGLIGINLVFATAGQFFNTANTVTIPFLVSREDLIAANSTYSMTVTICQLAGMIVLSPIVLATAGPEALFVICIALLLAASALARLLPTVEHDDGRPERQLPTLEDFRLAAAEYWTALRSIRNDPTTNLAMLHVTLASTLVLLFAVLVPRYMQAILRIAPDRAVSVFAPVAFGALLGFRFLPRVANRFGKVRTVAIGLTGLAVCLAAFGMVETIGDALRRTEHLNPFAEETAQRFGGLSILVALTTALSGPLGFSFALVNAPAQTILHERAPAEMRGRVFAAQVVLANGVSIIPLMLAGGVADIYGVSTVILGIAGIMAAVAGLSLWVDWKYGISAQVERQRPAGGVA